MIRGIAGIYDVSVVYEGKVVASKSIEVKYDLESLGSGTNYHLRKHDSNHNTGDYHYGTPDTNYKIKVAAEKFYTDYGFWQKPVKKKIVVNDQSLVWGGLFDINGDWKDPHETHKSGLVVDISHRYNSTEDTFLTFTERLKLEEVLDKVFGLDKCKDKVGHFHCKNY